MADKNLSRRQRREQQRRRNDYEQVLRTDAGKRVILDILGLCGVYSIAFAGTNREVTEFNLGGQNVGLRIIDRLNDLNRTVYPALLLSQARELEAKSEETDDNQEDENDDN